MPILPDFSNPSRPYPDSTDDAAMDQAERLWISSCDTDDARAEDERADLECLKEAARVARLDADAAMAEADRLAELVASRESSTAARIATGNIAIMEAIIDVLDRQ